MPAKLRFSLRKLLWAIAFIGIVLWVGRYPYFALQADRRFLARSHEATTLIASYKSIKPPEIDDADWQAAVHHVEVAWGAILSERACIADDELALIVSRMRGLFDQTNPIRSEGDLYSTLDLLGHFKAQVPSTNYLYSVRSELKDELQGKAAPSAGVINYARAMVGKKSEDVFTDLSAGLGHPDWRTRVMACRALKELGLAARRNKVIEAEVRALKDDDALVREVALESLAALGPESLATIPAIDDLLRRDQSSQVRVTAANVLSELDPAGTRSVPLLAAMLRDRDSALRLSLVRTLGDMGSKAHDASKALIEVVDQEEDQSIRGFAVQSFASVSPASKTVPILLEALRREQNRKATNVATTILQTLGHIGPEAAPAIPVLVETYNTALNQHERASAMMALGGIGPTARTALPTVLQATKATDWFVRAAALEALTKITVDPDVVLPPLISALKDKQGWNQKVAAANLGKLGPAARAAIPALEAATVDGAFVEPLEATRALRMIRGE